MTTQINSVEWGVRYSQFSKDDRIVIKEKIYPTEKKMIQAIDRLVKNTNFNQIESYFTNKVLVNI